MSPRTLTAPPTDRSMWRRLLRLVHPDGGGDGELFVWCRSLQEYVVGDTPKAEGHPSTEEPARVPYPVGADFAALTGRALVLGGEFAPVLALLRDCWPAGHLAHEQGRGASYKRLAAIGHAWSMTKAERVRWYRAAEEIPLSDRHAGHILNRSKARAA